jgi:hypothetical protein
LRITDANTGFLHPTTEFSVTIKGYRVNSFRTSSCKPLQLEGNLRWIYTAINARDFAGDRSGKKSVKDDVDVGQFAKKRSTKLPSRQKRKRGGRLPSRHVRLSAMQWVNLHLCHSQYPQTTQYL